MSGEPDIEQSELVQEHDVDSEEGMDNGYSIALYKAPDGRHFIHIIQSGMNSPVDGALGFHGWVADENLANWNDL